jgi:hypothetical protein
MLRHFPTRKFEQVTFDQLQAAWEPVHLRKTPSFRYLLPRVRDAFGGAKARDMTSERDRRAEARPRRRPRHAGRIAATAPRATPPSEPPAPRSLS